MAILIQFLTSKKAIALIVGLLIMLADSAGLSLPEEDLTNIVQMIMAYIVGQGIADAGKEAAKIDAQP